MAGAGYRSFASSEVLTASNVNTYLMDQAVMRFTDSTDRTNNGPTLAEGMLSYLDSDNSLHIYDGTAWRDTIGITSSADVSIGSDRLYFGGSASDDYISLDGATSTVSQGGTEHLRLTSALLGLNGNRIRFNDSTADTYYFQVTADSDAFIVANSATVCQWIEITADTEWALRINGPGDTTTPAYSFTGATNYGMYRGGGTNFLGLCVAGTPALGLTNSGAVAAGAQATGGATADMVWASVTLDGNTMYALRKTSSLRELKDDIDDWDLTEDQYRQIRPRSFCWRRSYVDPDTHERHEWGTEDTAETEPPPGALLHRQGGFVWDELADIDLHLITDQGVDTSGMLAATVAQVQKLMDRVEALEDS